MRFQTYCWWKLSCTSWQVVYPVVSKVLYIPGGAWFLPSTLFWTWWRGRQKVIESTSSYCSQKLGGKKMVKIVWGRFSSKKWRSRVGIQPALSLGHPFRGSPQPMICHRFGGSSRSGKLHIQDVLKPRTRWLWSFRKLFSLVKVVGKNWLSVALFWNKNSSGNQVTQYGMKHSRVLLSSSHCRVFF